MRKFEFLCLNLKHYKAFPENKTMATIVELISEICDLWNKSITSCIKRYTIHFNYMLYELGFISTLIQKQ